MKALVIDGPRASDWKLVDVEPRLDAMQDVVHGLIEHLDIGLGAYINEEGKFMPETCQPTARLYNSDEEMMDVIVGPVLCFGPVDEEGDETPFDPDVHMERLKRFIRPLVGEPACTFTPGDI